MMVALVRLRVKKISQYYNIFMKVTDGDSNVEESTACGSARSIFRRCWAKKRTGEGCLENPLVWYDPSLAES
jgi:hypothetical protein